ncbi:MAG: DUF748 domain-containing protein [Tepidisphaeraceae bacterium]|jgi:hypothetical protein
MSKTIEKKSTDSPSRKRRSIWRILLIILVVIVGAGCCARPMLPRVVRWYVNRVLDRNPLYTGRIGDVTIHLWRGAYTISDVRILKRTGDVPVPFIHVGQLDLAIQWNALYHGKIVGRVEMDEPELNFVDSSDDTDSQTGSGGPWLQTLQDLFPFTLNSVQINDGSIHFRSYRAAKPVDVYLSQLNASVDDLTNVNNSTTPLLTTVQASGLAMDQANFQFKMRLNPFSYRPTFHMAVQLLGLDVTKLNDLALTYGQFDFERGWFDLVLQADAQYGQIDGYVKPLFRNLKVFDLLYDIKHDDNPLQFFWQAVLGVTTGVLKNQPHDQFGTLIPFTGDMTKPNTDILSAVGNVLYNAFIRAYLPRLQNGTNSFDGMEFDQGSITDSSSIGDQQ